MGVGKGICKACGEIGDFGREQICYVCSRRRLPTGWMNVAFGLFCVVFFVFVAVLNQRLFSEWVAWSYNVKPSGLDVVLVLDTTASMGDELRIIKDKIRSIMSKVQSYDPGLRVRWGLVLYRDRGDEYVVRRIRLTEDYQKLAWEVDRLRAEGGGDWRESVNEALHVAVKEMNWDMRPEVAKVMFVIGDAPPHMDYPGDYDYHIELRQAALRGIKVVVVGCSGITRGDGDFKRMAEVGGGRFVYLAYSQVLENERGKARLLYEGDRVYEVSSLAVNWKLGVARLLENGEARSVPGAYWKRGGRVENNLDQLILWGLESAIRPGRTVGGVMDSK